MPVVTLASQVELTTTLAFCSLLLLHSPQKGRSLNITLNRKVGGRLRRLPMTFSRSELDLDLNGGFDVLLSGDDGHGGGGGGSCFGFGERVERHGMGHGGGVNLDVKDFLLFEVEGSEGGAGLAFGLAGGGGDRFVLGLGDRVVAGGEGDAVNAGGSSGDRFVNEGAEFAGVDLEVDEVGGGVANEFLLVVFVAVVGVEGDSGGLQFLDGGVGLEFFDDGGGPFGELALDGLASFVLNFDAELDAG